MKRLLILLTLLFSLSLMTQAQTSNGQVCVRAYEDLNANATYDAGEPFITQGLSIELLNDQGIVVATALMEDSIRAVQGMSCFQQLESGAYTLTVSSSEYTPTGGTVFVTQVSETSIEVFDFGATEIAANAVVDPVQTNTASEQNQVSTVLQKLLVASMAAFFVMILMAIIGLLIWLFVYYKRVRRLENQAYTYALAQQQQQASQAPYAPPVVSHPAAAKGDTSESLNPVIFDETGEHPSA